MKKIESRIRGSTGFVFGQGHAVKQSICTDVISSKA